MLQTQPPPRARVLLVEDDEAMRTVLVRALVKAGFEVAEAGTGSEALERLAQASVLPGELDLIISDMRLPGFDGLNLLATARALAVSLPVIMMTGFGTVATHEAASRLGAVATLDKPFALEELITVARAAIAPGGEARSQR